MTILYTCAFQIQFTQIELKLYKVQFDYVYTHYCIMKESCQKCNNNEVETFPTEVLLNEIEVTIVPLCDKCRRFWYS